MDKLITITRYKNGNFRFNLNIYNIYRLLRDELGFRYAKINNKGYYLKDDGYSFHIVNIYDIRDEFIDYIEKKFYDSKISKDITHVQFSNKFYDKCLPKNGTFLRNTLSSDYSLSIYKKESILRQVDFKFRVDEIIELFKEKDFTEYVKNKNKSIYFRKKSQKKWIVLVADIRNKSEYAKFDLFEIESENLIKLKKEIFLNCKLLCKDFCIPNDLPKLNEIL